MRLGVVFQRLKHDMEKWLLGNWRFATLEIAQVVDVLLCHWFPLEDMMLLGWYVEQNSGKKEKDEVPPQVQKNHVPIIFCIDDKRIFLWIKILNNCMSRCWVVNQKLTAQLNIPNKQMILYQGGGKKKNGQGVQTHIKPLFLFTFTKVYYEGDGTYPSFAQNVS